MQENYHKIFYSFELLQGLCYDIFFNVRPFKNFFSFTLTYENLSNLLSGPELHGVKREVDNRRLYIGTNQFQRTVSPVPLTIGVTDESVTPIWRQHFQSTSICRFHSLR